MKRMLALAVAAALLIAQCVPALAERTLDQQFDAIFKKYSAIGAAVVVCRGEEIVYEHYYGYAVKKTKEEVTADTWFRLASVSKMISSIGVMRQVERGVIGLEEDISDIFGFNFRSWKYPDTPITLRMVMNHTSPLAPNYDYNKDFSLLSGFDPANKNAKNKENYFTFKPGTKYKYSNMNGGLLGAVIEQTSGLNLNDYMTREVFALLGVDAAYSPTLLPHSETAACSYKKNGYVYKSREYVLSEVWDSTVNPAMHFKKSAFAVWTNLRGMARLGMMLCNMGTLEGVTILQRETVEQMLEEQNGKPGITCETAYGLDVERMSTLLSDRLVYGHQGLSQGILANLYFEPQSGLTFAMVSNGCDNTMSNHIGKMARKAFALAWETFGE